MEGHGRSFPITIVTFQVKKVMGGDLGFGTWIWDLDLGPGSGTWIWDLDLGLDLGLTIIALMKVRYWRYRHLDDSFHFTGIFNSGGKNNLNLL